jgi:hypothetical protein
MQPEERELITGLFDRLRPYESQPRDGEAERLIAERVVRQPAAPYLLAQTVLVQEQALKAAQERIAELEGKSSGFLGSAPKIGPWGAKPGMASPEVPATQGAPAAAPIAGPQGGSFMRTALATAAGVAGGALLFEGMRNLFAHNPGPFGGAAQAAPLLPPDSAREQFSSADLAQDDGAADDYDLTDDNSGFGGGGSDDL